MIEWHFQSISYILEKILFTFFMHLDWDTRHKPFITKEAHEYHRSALPCHWICSTSIMEEVPPPADHVIRPHHITLLTVLMMAFKDLAIKKFPPPYALHLHRVLLNEISEVCLNFYGFFVPTHLQGQVARPKSHKEFISEICSGPQADVPVCSEFQTAIRSIVRPGVQL